MLIGVRALSEMEPWRGHSRLTPNTQARLDALILLTMLSWETWATNQRVLEVKARLEVDKTISEVRLHKGDTNTHHVQETQQIFDHDEMMLWKRLHDLSALGHTEDALHICHISGLAFGVHPTFMVK